MVPHTDDGRVLFVIPWHERCLVGTTDEKAPEPILEPRATDDEIEFILRNAARYLDRDPERSDVLSVFAGLRPLVKHEGQATKKISREHEVIVSAVAAWSRSSVGKWTTYRKMAEDVMDSAIDVGALDRASCVTEELHLRGWLDREDPAMPQENWLRVYGADAVEVMSACDELDRGHEKLDERLALSSWCRFPCCSIMNWHEPWKMCWRGALERCCSMQRGPVKLPKMWRASWPQSSGRDAKWASEQAASFRGAGYWYQLG